jgi:hypothetical protein
MGVRKKAEAVFPPRIREKSVFEVDDSRLGIGTFSRPLLEDEARNFRTAWETDPMPGFHEFELGRERISFVAPPENVPIAWKSIDRLLAAVTNPVKKAS